MRLNDTDFQRITRKAPPDVYVSQDTQSLTITNDFKRVELSQETIAQYQRALNRMAPDVKWWQRVAAFLSASNKAGRRAKILKDAALIFLPYGKQVGDITEFLSQTFIKDMTKSETKSPAKSKTIITFALLTIVGVLGQLGIDLGLELSPDAEWLAIAAGIIGTILRLVTGKPVEFKTEK